MLRVEGDSMTAVRTGVTAVAAPATVAGHVPRAALIARLAVLLVLVYTVAPGVAAAANVNATWNGGAGNWNSTGNWSGGVVPNNGGGNTFSVFIDGGKAGNSLVTLDINPTITNLTIDRGDELRQPTGLGFAVVNGMVTNSGTFSMKAAGNNTDLTCAASTFAGPGTLLLSNDTGNRIFTGNTVCTNAQDHTIRGSGQLLVDSGGMSNAGTIIADQSNPLIIDPNGMGLTNTGTLEALNGGTLILQSALFTNANGNIQALDTSLVRLIGVSVAGGTLGTTGSGSINIESGSVLADFTNTGGLVLPNGQAGTISGTLTNNGTLSLQAAGNNTDLTCFGGATFGGTGSMVLSNDPHNRIFTNNTQCINSTDHTIRGAGQLLVDSGGMLNQGTIIADQSTALVIDPNATGFTNASILQAQDGGKLLLVSGPFANAGGVINALNGSEVDLSAVSVSGGQLVTAGSGTIEVSAGTVLSNVTSNGAVEQATGATGFISGTFTNHGTYALSAAGNNTDLTCKGMATFAGDGSLVLSNDTRNRIFTDNTLCTNAAGHTIHGSGQLLADSGGMLNQGTIIADQPTPLVIDPNGLGFTNASLLQAQNGATLVLASGTFTNTNAVVKALEASEVDLNAIGISGGQLLTSGSSTGRSSATSPAMRPSNRKPARPDSSPER
jgi:fibronectin-binding autotransporter adhesin